MNRRRTENGLGLDIFAIQPKLNQMLTHEYISNHVDTASSVTRAALFLSFDHPS